MNSVSIPKPRTMGWLAIVSLTLAIWMGASLLLDLVVMPSMYSAGMMREPDFISAGASLFATFNRVELLCAGVVLSGLLVLSSSCKTDLLYPKAAVMLATTLVLIPTFYIAFLSPEMSALGLTLNWFDPPSTPETMDTMHSIYWLLEVIKVGVIGTLLGICHRTE